MNVLLKEDVENLGYAGEVYKVADGYGRNFLIPQGMAVRATPNVMKQARVWRRKAETRRAELRAEHEALAAKIGETSLTFTAKAGDSGKLYGSITTTQVTDAMNEALGTEIDRRKVGTEPLRQLGEHHVIVRLSAEFQPTVKVIIQSEDGRELSEFEIEVAAEDDEAEDEVELELADAEEVEETAFDEFELA